MGLDKQYIGIPFVEGLETKTDEKFLPAPKLTGLFNGLVSKIGKIIKRNGYTEVNSSIFPSGTISTGDKLGTFKNQLIRFSSGTIYSQLEASNGSVNRGSILPVSVSGQQIIQNNYSQLDADWDISDGVAVVAWVDTRGGVRASVIDYNKGVDYTSDVSIDSTVTARTPKVCAIGSYIYVFYSYYGTTTIKYRRINLSDPTTFETAVSFPSANLSTTAPLFDAITASTFGIAYAYSNNAGKLTFGIFAGALSAPTVSEDTTTIADAVTGCINIAFQSATNYLWISYFTAAAGIKCAVFDQGLNQVRATTVVDAALLPIPRQITAEFESVTQARLIYQVETPTVLTFAPGGVNTGTDTITITGHGLVSGQKVQVSATTTIPTGLAAATDYFVIIVDANNIRLATSLANALAGTQIDITSTGAGTISLLSREVNNWTTIVKNNTFTTAGVAGTVAVSMRGVGLASKAFKQGSDILFNAVYDSSKLNAYVIQPADINAGTDVITITAHGYPTGARVKIATGGTLPAGLLDNLDYYVINLTVNTIKLAKSLSDAIAGTAVDITATGVAAHLVISQDGQGLQPTYFLMKTDGTIVAKMRQTQAQNISVQTLPKVVSTETSMWATPFQIKVGIETPSAMVFGIRGLAFEKFNFVSSNRFTSKEMGGSLVITGGYLSSYDGSKPTELGFHVFPENVIGTSYGAGGLLGNGVYQYRMVYEWYDSQGQRHQSAASPAVTMPTTGAATGLARLVIETLRLTNKKSPISDVAIHIFRTQVNLTTFYRLTTLNVSTFNNTADNYISYTDAAADSTISSNETLYISAGVVDTIQPSAAKLFAINKSRGFVVPSETPNDIWFSKEYITADCLSFSDSFVKRVDSSGGDIKAIATMDDKVVFFKDQRIGFFSGDGPFDTGAQDTFTEPETITVDVGIQDVESLTLTSQGLYFKSSKGIHILSRSLEIEYIGADVEAYNSDTITSANLIPDTNQVRFTTSSGVALVYDYYRKAWQVFNNHDIKDAVIFDGVYTYLSNQNSKVYQESSGFYKDGNVNIPLIVETGWMKLNDLQGFMRCWRGAILGKFLSSHQLKISIAYDYQPYYADFIYWDAGSVLSTPTFGGGSTFGGGTTFGGSTDYVYQVRFDMPRQKFESVKFRLEDVVSGDSNASMELSHLMLECGVKRGLNKLRSEKSVG